MKILIIEDDHTNMKLTNDLLRIHNYTTLSATNAKKGIETAEQEQPDLILMDIQMPGLDGYQALRVLKSNIKTREIPVIALTAHVLDEDVKRILESGFDNYIPKPFMTPLKKGGL